MKKIVGIFILVLCVSIVVVSVQQIYHILFPSITQTQFIPDKAEVTFLAVAEWQDKTTHEVLYNKYEEIKSLEKCIEYLDKIYIKNPKLSQYDFHGICMNQDTLDLEYEINK